MSRAVSLQSLIGSLGGDDVESKAAHGATFHQTSQVDAVLRINADLQQKLLEQEQRMKEQEQRMNEQERAMALLQQQVASSPSPRSQRDDA